MQIVSNIRRLLRSTDAPSKNYGDLYRTRRLSKGRVLIEFVEQRSFRDRVLVGMIDVDSRVEIVRSQVEVVHCRGNESYSRRH